MPVWCVLKMYNLFLITNRPFSRPAEWSSPRLKNLQPNMPDKVTYLTNHKKTGLAIFRKKKKTTGLVCGKHKRKGCLDRPECPAQPSWQPASVSKTKITRRAARSLVSAARCAILSFIDYVDNGIGPRCLKSIRRNHFLGLKYGGSFLHPAMTLVGPCCHPLHVQSSPDCVRST